MMATSMTMGAPASAVWRGCGDGFVRADLEPGEDGYEACDDGNQFRTDACVDCVPALRRRARSRRRRDLRWRQRGARRWLRGGLPVCACGDGHASADVEPGGVGYELCDDGNQDPEGAVETTATRTLCRRGSGRDQTIWRTAAGRSLRRTLKRVTGSTGWT